MIATEERVRAEERKAGADRVLQAERARKAAEKALDDQKKEQDRLIAIARREGRAAYDKATKAAVDAEKARSAAQIQKLGSKMAALQGQIDAQEAAGLEGAGLDLPEELRRTFPDDVFRSVGGEGANLVQEVRETGRECGVIVYDTRKHEAWRDAFVTRIRK